MTSVVGAVDKAVSLMANAPTNGRERTISILSALVGILFGSVATGVVQTFVVRGEMDALRTEVELLKREVQYQSSRSPEFPYFSKDAIEFRKDVRDHLADGRIHQERVTEAERAAFIREMLDAYGYKPGAGK